MERDPVRLRAIAKALRALPNASDPEVKLQADMLESMADQIESQQKQAEVLTKIEDTITQKTPNDFTATQFEKTSTSTATSTQAEKAVPTTVDPVPAVVPAPAEKTSVERAAEAAATHLLNLQRNAGGAVKTVKHKEDKALVSRFQSLANTTADGKAGPGTLALMAKHGVCELPLVMYWPTSATSKTVLKYREALYAVADTKPEPCASQIRQSASKERGQAGIVGSMPA
jgi:hypothetical protein